MSSGISKKTKEQYDYILELLREPMTVREVAEHMNIDLYMMHRHFLNLKKSKCVKEGELRCIKGRRDSYTFTSTGMPYIHSMVSRAKQYQEMKADAVPKRVIKEGNITTYNLSHHDNYSYRRAPEKPHLGAGSMAMF